MKEKKENIIFFDGVCGLCNTFIDFVLPLDKKQLFKFAPLQGDTAKKLLPNDLQKDLKTIVFYKQGEITTKSRAVLGILSKLKFPYSTLAIFKIIPSFISDCIYNFVALNRYKWFGKKETCRFPTAAERAKFLD